jgi:hypothetical protein
MRGIEGLIACYFEFLFQHLTHENENTACMSALNSTAVRAFNQAGNIGKLARARRFSHSPRRVLFLTDFL